MCYWNDRRFTPALFRVSIGVRHGVRDMDGGARRTRAGGGGQLPRHHQPHAHHACGPARARRARRGSHASNSTLSPSGCEPKGPNSPCAPTNAPSSPRTHPTAGRPPLAPLSPCNAISTHTAPAARSAIIGMHRTPLSLCPRTRPRLSRLALPLAVAARPLVEICRLQPISPPSGYEPNGAFRHQTSDLSASTRSRFSGTLPGAKLARTFFRLRCRRPPPLTAQIMISRDSHVIPSLL